MSGLRSGVPVQPIQGPVQPTDPILSLGCEFCGAETLATESGFLKERVVCAACRVRVQWCSGCDGAGCDACDGQGTDPEVGCQKTGGEFCDPAEGYCEPCAIRAQEDAADRADALREHYAVMGWVR